MTLLPSEARACADLVQAVGIPAAVQLLRPEAMAAAVAVLGDELRRLQSYVAGEMTGHAGGPLEVTP